MPTGGHKKTVVSKPIDTTQLFQKITYWIKNGQAISIKKMPQWVKLAQHTHQQREP